MYSQMSSLIEEDGHTLMFTFIEESKKRDIRIFLEKCFQNYFLRYGIYLWTTWKINIVSNKKGDKLGFAYVYISNTEFYNILLGRERDGSLRKIRKENPHFPISSPFLQIKSFCFDTEEYIYVPDNDIIEFPYVLLGDREIKPRIVPYIPRRIFDNSFLICNRAPMTITREDIEKEISFFEDRKVEVVLIDEERKKSILLQFGDNMNATFSLVMLRRIKIKKGNYIFYIFFSVI